MGLSLNQGLIKVAEKKIKSNFLNRFWW